MAWRMDEGWRDLRYSIRSLRRAPVHTLAVVSLLTLAIGANVAIFSLVNALLLRDLPVDRPEELVTVKRMSKGTSQGLSVPLYDELRSRLTSIPLAALSDVQLSLGSAGPPEPDSLEIPGALVSGHYFHVLGARAAIGRLIGPEDDRFADPKPVIVLSHALWTRRFGADPGVVGRDVWLPGGRVTVIGVASPELRALGGDRGLGGEFWLPLNLQPMVSGTDRRRNPGSSILRVFGRLDAATATERFRAEVTAIEQSLTAPLMRPDSSLQVFSARRGFNDQLATQYWPALRVLLAAALLLLVIACANVAGLQIARIGRQRHEIAVREALGSGRGRLVRQLVIESTLLAVTGGALGIAWSAIGARALVAIAVPAGAPDVDLSLDRTVIAFAAGIAVMATIIFGLMPAVQLLRRSTASSLRTVSRGSTLRHRHVLHRVVVSAQVVLAVILLTATVAFARSVFRLYSTDLGFDRDGMIIASVDARPAGIQTAEQYAQLERDLVTMLGSRPGVQSVSVAAAGFFGGARRSTRTYAVNGQQFGAADDPPLFMNQVSNHYLRAFRVPFIEGRDFTDDDRAGAMRVAVVNQEFARRYTAGGSPIGSRLRLNDSTDEISIVGMVADAKLNNPREEAVPLVFLPFQQFPAGFSHVCIRAAGTSDLNRVRDAIVALNPRLRVSRIQTVDEAFANTVSQDVLLARLSSVLGLSAVLLVSFGVYGMISTLVTSRTKELGVRLAIGATPRRVLADVVRDSLARVAPGLVLGVVLSYAAGRAIAAQLFEVSPSDPMTTVLAVGLVVMVTMLAAYWPARRASRTPPTIAMRVE